MRTTVRRKTQGKGWKLLNRGLIGAVLLMAMLLVGVQLARAEVTTGRTAVPATTAYHFSSHPMISGTVVSVNDRQMVVNTDQGERVILEVDSRTMAPRDLGPGMVMRAEFLALEDCRFYAQRIMPLRGGLSTNRLQAYANTHDSREAIAHNSLALSGYHGEYTENRVGGNESAPPTAGEQSPGTMMTATATTADHQFSAHPMISGKVVSVNDHRLVVETDQGQHVGMVMDSHTMVPGEIAPGSVMRAEFTQMKDGRYYAKRISRIGSGVADREQAYAHTRDSDLAIAGNPSDCGFVSAATGSTVTSAMERGGVVVSSDPVVVRSAPVPIVEETLPQTASHQPLILMFGLLALGSAGLVTVARGLRVV